MLHTTVGTNLSGKPVVLLVAILGVLKTEVGAFALPSKLEAAAVKAVARLIGFLNFSSGGASSCSEKSF